MEDLDYEVGLFENLKILRLTLAANMDVPAFFIFHDSVAKEIARLFPQTEIELLSIHGIGPKKVEQFGEAILDVVNNYIRSHNITFETINKFSYSIDSCDDIDYDKNLYDILCNYVKENDFFRNPYPQITYSIIKNICRTYPTTPRDLLNIQGIGKKKYELYGEDFIKMISEYTNKNPILVKEIMGNYASITENSLSDFTKQTKALKYLIICNSKEAPTVCNRLDLLINCLYSIRDSYTFKDKDTLRLTSGGTLKTLLRNIVEPILNLSIDNNTNETISYILSKNSASKIKLEHKYNIDSNKLSSILSLYAYSNACDHILDEYSDKGYNMTKYNIKYFENLLNSDKDKILIDLLFVLESILSQEESLYNRTENFIQVL